MVLPLMTVSAIFYMSFDYSHKMARCMKDADAVSEPRMTRSWVDQLREAELLNTAQTLKWARLNDPPQDLLELGRAKLD